MYVLTLKGDVQAAQAQLGAQPWVSALKTTAVNGYTQWQISVTDEDKAESELLPALFQAGKVQVRDFGRKQYNLEEVFLKLVEGSENGR